MMKKYLRPVAAALVFCFFLGLTACAGPVDPAPSTTQRPAAQTAAPTETTAPAEQLSSPLEFIGLNVADLLAFYGEEYTLDYLAGSTYILFPGSPLFLFGAYVENVTNDLVVRQVVSFDDLPLLDGLSGTMTYPELSSALGDAASLEEPAYYYNEMDEYYAYQLRFEYQDYSFVYTWLDDPMTADSYTVWVCHNDVPTVPEA